MLQKILIVGVNGMLGNAVYKYLLEKRYKVFGLSKEGGKGFIKYEISKDNLHEFKNIIKKYRINVIINCASINNVNRENFEESIIVNSLFPNYISRYISSKRIKFFHISTNGFYSNNGNNKELAEPLFKSLYGISKFLGEWKQQGTLCIRTSIIGYNPNSYKEGGILNRFLNLKNGKKITGYKNVLWNGITTVTLSRIIEKLLKKNKTEGIINIAGEIISKYKLLSLFKTTFKKNILIKRGNNEINLNQTIIASKAQKTFSYLIKPTKDQIKELKEWYKL